MKFASLLLMFVAGLTASLSDERQLRCTCLFTNFYNRQLDLSCGFKAASDQEQAVQRKPFCSQETTGRVPRTYEYVPEVGFFYKVFRTNKNYESALVRCQQDGAFLAIPKSRAEAQAIAAIMQKTPAVREAFIGINDLKRKGFFTSVQGVALSSLGYSQWLPDQPDNSGPSGEPCVTINPDGLYNDQRCEFPMNFVCQRVLTPLPPTGYKYIPQLGFYKHYTTPETYAGAKQRCKDDGGHLAVLDTQDEADELVKFYDINNVPESYVGLNDLEKEGVFVTETGKLVTELSFVNWYVGEPNNDGPQGEDCVTFHRGGTINDVVCSIKNPFFCEIPFPKY